MTRISVIVCTYNRAAILKRALESLVQQTLDKSLYEIIVVDNASTDNTSEVIGEFSSVNKNCNFQAVHEARKGLGYARNTGVKRAKGEYIGFLDDDAIADKDWLANALHCFERVEPTPLVVGGPIFPLYLTSKPSWFKDAFEIRCWGNRQRFLTYGENYFSGSNMIISRSAVIEFGGFNVEVGMKGEFLSAGEETSLFERIVGQAESPSVFYYSPQLTVFHFVPGFKMTISYQLKRAFAKGQARYLRRTPHRIKDRWECVVTIAYNIAAQCWHARANRRLNSSFRSWIVETLIPIAAGIGHLFGCLGIIIPVKQQVWEDNLQS